MASFLRKSFLLNPRLREGERKYKKEKSLVSICEIGSPGGNFNSCQMFRENAERKFSTFADAFHQAPTPSVCVKTLTPVRGASEEKELCGPGKGE